MPNIDMTEADDQNRIFEGVHVVEDKNNYANDVPDDKLHKILTRSRSNLSVDFGWCQRWRNLFCRQNANF